MVKSSGFIASLFIFNLGPHDIDAYRTAMRDSELIGPELDELDTVPRAYERGRIALDHRAIGAVGHASLERRSAGDRLSIREMAARRMDSQYSAARSHSQVASQASLMMPQSQRQPPKLRGDMEWSRLIGHPS
jgi:hypothetical protein